MPDSWKSGEPSRSGVDSGLSLPPIFCCSSISLPAVPDWAFSCCAHGEREYLWFAATEFANAAFGALWIYEAFHAVDLRVFLACQIACKLPLLFVFLFFLVALLKQRRNWIYWIAMASALVAPSRHL